MAFVADHSGAQVPQDGNSRKYGGDEMIEDLCPPRLDECPENALGPYSRRVPVSSLKEADVLQALHRVSSEIADFVAAGDKSDANRHSNLGRHHGQNAMPGTISRQSTVLHDETRRAQLGRESTRQGESRPGEVGSRSGSVYDRAMERAMERESASGTDRLGGDVSGRSSRAANRKIREVAPLPEPIDGHSKLPSVRSVTRTKRIADVPLVRSIHIQRSQPSNGPVKSMHSSARSAHLVPAAQTYVPYIPSVPGAPYASAMPLVHLSPYPGSPPLGNSLASAPTTSRILQTSLQPSSSSSFFSSSSSSSSHSSSSTSTYFVRETSSLALDQATPQQHATLMSGVVRAITYSLEMLPTGAQLRLVQMFGSLQHCSIRILQVGFAYTVYLYLDYLTLAPGHAFYECKGFAQYLGLLGITWIKKLALLAMLGFALLIVATDICRKMGMGGDQIERK